jgi:LAO/AO transport system kinase
MPEKNIPDDPQYYVRGVLDRNRRILAKTITLIESSHPAHQELARVILDKLLPDTGKSVRVGVTGVPGVGKSTFIESLGMMLVKRGRSLAVLAVDPSSRRSGGSVMADKMRMERLSVEGNAFIRPSPSGATLGGVARKTREAMLVCEAAGFDVIIVETVGVGQSESRESKKGCWSLPTRLLSTRLTEIILIRLKTPERNMNLLFIF